jgi:glycerol-3-phosphate dehydrogenase (NAD(P)+)
LGQKKIGVVGGGAWGTALAVHLGRIGHEVRLWIREAEVVERMIERRDNPAYLPGVRVPETVRPVAEIGLAVDRADVVIGSVPAQFSRVTYREIAPRIVKGTPVVVTTKGIEERSLALPLEVAAAELGEASPLAILSGPSFAREVAMGLPTAVVVASSSRELANRLQKTLSSRELRIYTNGDPAGVQLAAALKNVMAIAVGIGDSLARAGLITRGLAEIRRLVMARGGEEGTASGLAGLGDLVLTCTGELSRNRQVGQRLGRGERLRDILEGSRSVAEGVRTARSARDLARRDGVEMPIVEGVYRILYEDESPEKGLDRLLSRPLTSEDEPTRHSGT